MSMNPGHKNSAQVQQPQELLLDVSGLDHPEPFEEAMSCLKYLSKGSFLHMMHRRTPYPLLQILNENGFDFKIIAAQKAVFEALIWKTDDMATGNYCKNDNCLICYCTNR